MTGFGGNPRVAVPGGGGAGGMLVLKENDGVNSATCSNPAAGQFNPLSQDATQRRLVDLRGTQTVRLYAFPDITLVAAHQIQVRYHPTSTNLNLASSDPGWKVLLTSAGSHTATVWFLTDAIDVPPDARIAACQLQIGWYGGDGAADPNLYGAYLLFT
jgi:hypothetical protein